MRSRKTRKNSRISPKRASGNADARPDGEKASVEGLIQQARFVATNVEGVIVLNSGHWLMEEAADQVMPKIAEFLGR